MPLGRIGEHGFDLEAFISRLEYHMFKADISAAQLSKRAGLNARAVKDILERRVESPRVKTVLALEAALDLRPGTLLGFTSALILHELQELLGELDEVTQKKLLETILTLREKACHDHAGRGAA